jgi:glycosyltransferase involved in cell wall biosynthesis
MACGKLIISTPEGVEGIIGLIPNEHYMLAGSVQEFPDIIFSIRQSPAEIKRISKNARQFVLDHYDWRATMTEFADRLLM